MPKAIITSYPVANFRSIVKTPKLTRARALPGNNNNVLFHVLLRRPVVRDIIRRNNIITK